MSGNVNVSLGNAKLDSCLGALGAERIESSNYVLIPKGQLCTRYYPIKITNCTVTNSEVTQIINGIVFARES